MLLGNDRMISRWPARGGPVVVDDIVYFGAGIWPSEGIFLYALDPATGEVLWQNDSSGSIEMDQPHGTARAKSGLSAQGYLAACGDRSGSDRPSRAGRPESVGRGVAAFSAAERISRPAGRMSSRSTTTSPTAVFCTQRPMPSRVSTRSAFRWPCIRTT